jgi:hypothetical protein
MLGSRRPEGMEIGATMMDSREAIKGLDGYSEILVSLSVLLGSKMFEEKSDEQIRTFYDRLLVQIKEAQRDAKWIALEIMKDIHHVGTKQDQSGDLIGIGAAIQRYVIADNQASEALKKKGGDAPPPNSVAEAIATFRKKHGMIEKVA